MPKDSDKKKGKFKIADPTTQIEAYLNESSRYKLGEIGYHFHHIKKMQPIFAFDYISLNQGDKCFNCTAYTVSDYIGLLEGLKKVSQFTYEKLHDTKSFRFHKVKFDEKNVALTRKEFKQILTQKEDSLEDEELPNVWQFDLQYIAKARVAGFLYKGVFYLVWYDRNHLIYPRN
jgi:hypothetical protein